ncbi:hypothetical protein [Pseudodesulfovibrio piezophilus]|uniref:Lipoprotein n=1 Tax=Pseudodesulfovibrio piezophilus (strain DSM 21447 / JCM 15486 / C1TLV30) TaxID=1322246 RepID=M1WPT2_PSEP2|nr:hypothetical protein [Pseudodesulfovibrio piezophilus]CCH47277.1 conserved protein of unknown function [Pseudodesulfovibrio piezophilus C1TLV30]
MFGRWVLNTFLTIFILFFVGCGVFYSDEDGVDSMKTLFLDDGFEFVVNIEKGESHAVDMPEPKTAGYVIVGASFDPHLLKLIHYTKYEKQDETRVQYAFKALADGSSDILVKMVPVKGGDSVLYKRISINVGDKRSVF